MKLKSLDIETILGEEERLPCTFLVDAADMGCLDPTLHSVDLPAKSRVSLPLWIANILAEKSAVQIELPKHFGKRMREDIRAGPEAIKLRDFSFYYFEVGLRLGAITEDSDLMMTLRQAISGDRFKTVTYHTLFRLVYLSCLRCICSFYPIDVCGWTIVVVAQM